MKWLLTQTVIRMNKTNLWEEHIDPDTGASSIEHHIPKVVQTWCAPKDHSFVFIGGSLRTAKCSKCTHTVPFIPGFNQIKDGKILQAGV